MLFSGDALPRRRKAEQRLHLAADLQRRQCLVDRNVGPRDRYSGLHRANELRAVRKAERQSAERDRLLRRQKLPPYRVTALAVQDFAGLEIAFGRANDVCTEANVRAPRLTTQPDVSYRDP